MKKEILKYPARHRRGYRRIVSPANARLRLIEFGVVTLARGESVDLCFSGKEIAVTILRGTLSVETADRKIILGPRKSVFDELPSAVYAKGIERLALTARSKVEALVSSAPARARKPLVKVIEPSEVTERVVGTGTYERNVRTIIGEDFPAERLLVGETINQAGKWSSYPPHRHEKHSPPHEAKLEEVYYYKLENPKAFGIQRIYTDDARIDETHTVREGDLCVLPRGYHPVSATPNSRLYYFWALAGKSRKMHVRNDPNFA
jgi:5-deoxy-glucuronate isomerase